ncbi:MAG: AraC family transcriptional regulator, partial [Hyphomicrobiales bacterium]|nr:AraC family transcriptional regulator [Hyphomicrobiales bacterium]
MGTQPTIISGALASLDRHLWRHGVDCSALAHDCGISDEALLAPETEIPLTSFVRIYEEGADRIATADLGWSTGIDFDIACLGDIGLAILTAPTLGAALKTFSDFTQLIQSASEIRLRVEGTEAVLSYRILDPDIWPRRQDAEFTVSIFHHLIRRCAGPGFRPTMIAFEHAAMRAEQEIRETAGCDCVFGQLTNAISFPASLLDRPMPTAEAIRYRSVQRQLSVCLRDQLRQMPAGTRVEMAILGSLGTRPT